jgi:bidirectional [NiFe] hydrogenase diaphorase subunit
MVAAIAQAEHVKAGETTADGQLSLLYARCLGSCGLVPAVVFDGEVVGKVRVPEVLERIRGWTRHDVGGTR